ncbi:PAS domain-containing protein [Temperatibacter marinus]|uniref:PAS domain-containing protein n=1 Tax=Temperatibacter marinus TaxID=1456591 RepID=A0AA52EK44_9PROT|nr:PAS domain-containing protein [Temperatibacter marinus]WND03491.1 PAS domain-containing protein [Temperatibacter marinus]
MILFKDIDDHIENEDVLSLAKIWQERAVSCSSGVPKKDSFPIQSLVGILPHVAIFGLTEKNEVMFKLTGSFIDQLFAKNLSGETLSAISQGENLEKMAAFHHEIMTQPCGAYVNTRFVGDNGYLFTYETLTLPLILEDGTPGSMAVLYAEGIHPSRYEEGQISSALREEPLSTFWIDIGSGTPEGHEQTFTRYVSDQ